MKTDWTHLDHARKSDGPYGTAPGERMGAFFLRCGTAQIVAIASQGSDEVPWEHVSARVTTHKGDRLPTWAEMCWLKDQFWDEEECVVQFHPPRSDYVNNHPFVLHLWKPLAVEMPRPPSIAVGIK